METGLTRESQPERDDATLAWRADYERLRPRLLAILGRLRASGYPVVTSMALDIVHDFFVEAWAGLHDRFDPGRGAWDSYVGGAFHRFARRRIVTEARWRRRLPIDAERAAGPSEEPDVDVDKLRRALAALPADGRDRLLARFGEEPLTERRLAERLGVSRYAVRERLIRSLASLASALGTLGPGGSNDAAVARMLFEEGRGERAVAAELGLTSGQVRAARRRVLAAVGRTLAR